MSDASSALLAVLDDGRVDLLAVATEITPESPQGAEVDEQAAEQFLRAFEALLREGLEGGREQRELVLQTAVPALVANGQSTLELVESHVAFFVALSSVMIDAVEAGVRPAARVWMARYASEYVREVAETALAAERERTEPRA